MATDQDILGRADVNDLEAIIAITNTDVTEAIHTVEDHADAIFTWDYEKGARPALNKLYEKAKSAQWNGETDLDWSIDVDPEKVINELQGTNAAGPFQWIVEHPDSPLKNFGDKEWTQVGVESMNWRLSQFMHGEQGALICTAKIVETVPWIDAKYYASTQVMDEARHVEVFAKYLQDKLTGFYPINAHLKMLLDDIVQDSRWDMTYLGMQIMVGGLALAAFGFMYQLTEEPPLKKLLRYVMSDEARHVAFGVLSLKEYYAELSDAELKERQDFLLENTLRSRARSVTPEIWERLGVKLEDVAPSLMQAAQNRKLNQFAGFQAGFFAKLVPNVRKLGLLDANKGYLREKWGEAGLLEYEFADDTGTDYETYDEVAKDRAAAAAAN